MKKKKLKEPKSTNKAKAKFLGKTMKQTSYKDLKRQAVALGMPFPDVINASIGQLSNFIAETDNTPDTSLIDKYDDYVEKCLMEIGYNKRDAIMNARLRLGFIGEEDPETGEKRMKRVPGIKKEKKPKREKTEQGFVKGTKKSFVMELAIKGLSLEEVTTKFKKAYPDGNDKSVKIWYRQGIKLKK